MGVRGIITKRFILLQCKDYVVVSGNRKLAVGKVISNDILWFKRINLEDENIKDQLFQLELELGLRVGNLI